MLLLENLEPAVKITPPKNFRPGVEFDGLEGIATTPGSLEQVNFDDFLIEAGFDPEEIEIVGAPRTSRWQRYDGEWLTSWKFAFRKKNKSIDLPLLYAQAKAKYKKPSVKPTDADKALVIGTADFQVGKVGSRGGTKELIERVFASYANIEQQLKRGKYSHVVILDGGDIIEGVENTANLQQLATNDLSPMQQTDLAASLMWDLIKLVAKYTPKITYASVGSNHCQFRSSKQAVGRPGVDDWGIVILQQLRRLSTEVGLPVTFVIPQPHDESVAFDVFDDGFHILGLAHGHQAARPDAIPNWFMKQAWGQQPLAAATILTTGHFHHTRVEELGQSPNGGSRWWIQLSTSDNGSDWYRLTSGSDSSTGITCFELQKGIHFSGTVLRF